MEKRMIVRFILIVAIIFIGGALYYFSTISINSNVNIVDNNGAGYNILIISSGSEFKNAIIDHIKSYADSLEIGYKVVDSKRNFKEDLSLFDVIVLMTPINEGTLTQGTFDLIDEIKTQKPIILLETYDAKSNQENYGVDTISAASNINKTEDVANEIIQKIESILIQ